MAISVGVDRRTGAVLLGWPHVVQSLDVLWTTFIGERVLREDVGNPGLRLLGENMTRGNVLRFWQVIKVVTDLYEPRFSIVQIRLARTSVEELRGGAMPFTVTGIYRPHALDGDMRPEGPRDVILNSDGRLEG